MIPHVYVFYSIVRNALSYLVSIFKQETRKSFDTVVHLRNSQLCMSKVLGTVLSVIMFRL